MHGSPKRLRHQSTSFVKEQMKGKFQMHSIGAVVRN